VKAFGIICRVLTNDCILGQKFTKGLTGLENLLTFDRSFEADEADGHPITAHPP